MFEKVNATKVYMQIVEQIQRLIKEGKLKPGDRLPPERELARQLGISRAPLREAISALEILEVIESRSGKGNIVKNPTNSFSQRIRELEDEESPLELLEAREVLETEIAWLAAQKATPDDIAEMEEQLNAMRKAMHDTRRTIQLDREFHIAVAKGAHNSVLFAMMKHLGDGLKGELWLRTTEKTCGRPGHAERVLQEHADILTAIKKGDRETARRLMHRHLAKVRKDLFGDLAG